MVFSLSRLLLYLFSSFVPMVLLNNNCAVHTSKLVPPSRYSSPLADHLLYVSIFNVPAFHYLIQVGLGLARPWRGYGAAWMIRGLVWKRERR